MSNDFIKSNVLNLFLCNKSITKNLHYWMNNIFKMSDEFMLYINVGLKTAYFIYIYGRRSVSETHTINVDHQMLIYKYESVFFNILSGSIWIYFLLNIVAKSYFIPCKYCPLLPFQAIICILWDFSKSPVISVNDGSHFILDGSEVLSMQDEDNLKTA